jgi:hypothetical protein
MPQEYPLPAFDGGKNNKYEPYIIADNESPDCLNAYSDDLGGVQSRYGSSKFNTVAVGSFANHGLYTVRRDDGNQTMVGWWNGSMYTLEGVATTFTTVPSAQSVYTAGRYVCQVVYQNLAFYGNGVGENYKWNGTDFTRMGIPQPNSTPAVSGTSAGTLTGSYQYKVSYVNSYVVEGDVSSNTTTITYVSQIGGLTNIPVAPTSYGVSARKIYRKDVVTGTTFLLLTTINDNTTTTYADNTPNAGLGAAAPLDQGQPPKFEFAVTHKERIFFKAVDDQFIYYSDLGNPFVVKVLSFQKFGDGDGELVRGLGVQGDALSVYKDVTPWNLYMQDTDDANWVPLRTQGKYGAAGHYSIVDYDKYQMYLGRNFEGVVNFAAMTGSAAVPDLVSLSISGIQAESKSDRIEPDIRLFNTSQLPKVFGIRFNNKLWYAVPYGAIATSNTRVYVFDYVQRDKERANGAWWPMQYPFSPTFFTIFNGNLYCGINEPTGFVYRLEVPGSYADDGQAFNSYYWTKELEGFKNQKEHHKDFRRLNLTMGTLGNWDVGITQRIDSDIGVGDRQPVNISPGGGIWGTLIWGTGTWGGGSIRKPFKIETGTANGVKIQFRFDNGEVAGQAFKVLRGTLFYNDRGRR